MYKNEPKNAVKQFKNKFNHKQVANIVRQPMGVFNNGQGG